MRLCGQMGLLWGPQAHEWAQNFRSRKGPVPLAHNEHSPLRRVIGVLNQSEAARPFVR